MKIEAKDIFFTNKDVESSDIDFSEHPIVSGFVKTRKLKNFVIVFYNLKLDQSVEVRYGHDKSGMLFEYVMNSVNTSHATDKASLQPQNGTTNIYNESVCSDEHSSNKTVFSKNAHYSSLGIKPTDQFLQSLAKQEFSFSKKIQNILDGNNDFLLARNVVDIELTQIANKIVNQFRSHEFIPDLVDAYCLEFLVTAMQSEKNDVENITKIKNVMKSILPEKVSAENVSKQLEVSKRTLSSMCSEYGRTFNCIKKEVFEQEYKKLVSTGLDELEISRYLGYSSVSYMRETLSIK